MSSQMSRRFDGSSVSVSFSRAKVESFLLISPFVAYGDNSAIQEEVQNGVAVRMALFTLVLTGGKQE